MPRQKIAIVLTGPPASGKGTQVRAAQAEVSCIPNDCELTAVHRILEARYVIEYGRDLLRMYRWRAACTAARPSGTSCRHRFVGGRQSRYASASTLSTSPPVRPPSSTIVLPHSLPPALTTSHLSCAPSLLHSRACVTHRSTIKPHTIHRCQLELQTGKRPAYCSVKSAVPLLSTRRYAACARRDGQCGGQAGAQSHVLGAKDPAPNH